MKLRKYNCPFCGGDIELSVPGVDETGNDECWDSLIRCPRCLLLHFKEVWSDGAVQLRFIITDKSDCETNSPSGDKA